jgi:hypothetical protein
VLWTWHACVSEVILDHVKNRREEVCVCHSPAIPVW